MSRKPHAPLLALALLSAASPAPGAGSGLELVREIPLKGKAGRLDHLALDARGGRLFIANLSNDSLDVVDLKAGRLVKQIPGQKKAQGVAYVPGLDRVFVGTGGGACNVFGGRDYSLLRSIKLPDADNVRYDPRSGRVYVAHAEKSLTAIDAKTFETKAAIKLPGAAEAFQLDPGGHRIFLNSPEAGRVVVIDTRKDRVTASYPLKRAGANYPLAVDATRRRLFVGCREPAAVVVLDAGDGHEVARVGIPKDTDDLYYDATRKRVYATCGQGYVAVIAQVDADHYRLAEKVPTARGARTGLFDPGSGRLYVVLPAGGGKGPRVRVYQAKR
jgi:hypothetical protein